jgi:4-amino-4-deoxy-L-arabinose transferase-like glycosyltransferase
MLNRIGLAVRAGMWRHPALSWLTLATLVSLALNWRLFGLPMISDEGGYAFVAQRWTDGRGELYDDLWISRPQGIFVAYAAILRTLGGETVDIRVGAWLVGILTMGVLWLFASTWKGPRVAAGATMLFALLMCSPAIEGFTANAEVFMALPAALAALCLLHAARGGWRWWWLLSAGLLAGVATLLKPSGIVMAPVAVGLLWLTQMAGGGPGALGRVVRGAVLVSVGFAAAIAPALLHGYVTGWDRFVYGAFSYRMFHQSTATNSATHHTRALFDLLARSWPVLATVAVVLATRSALDLIAARGRRAGSRRPRASSQPAGPARFGSGSCPPGGLGAVRDGRPVRLLLRLWLIGCLAGIAMGGDWWFHYLIQAAVPGAIWLAVALSEIRPRMPRRLWSAVVVAVVAMLILPYSVLTLPSRSAMTESLYGHPGYADQEAIARYVNEHTTPETPIFVAFDQAALHYLADRPSTYRYLYDQELRAFPESEAELVAMVESASRPKYIVGTRQVAPFEDRGRAFWDAVQRNYVLETTVRGVPIFRAKAEPPMRFVP